MTPGSTIEKLLQSTGMKIILLIFTCGLLLGPAGSALSATITGIISLTPGQSAGTGMCFFIKAHTSSSSQNLSQHAYIYQGDNSTNYSIAIPNDAANNWTVYYDRTDCWASSSSSTDGYWGLGYYNSSSTVLHAVDATQLAGGSDHSDIDMTVFEGNTINGTISLPNGQVAKEDIVLFIRAQVTGTTADTPVTFTPFGYGYESNMAFAETSVYRTVFITQGSSSADYALTISPETGINWTVFYSCYSCGKKYQETGYYSTSGTVGKVSGATPVAGASDHGNINLTLLKRKGMLCFPVRSKDGQISIISM